ncbi:PhzF family phenazine biosynthesis protein [Pseudoalteromonas umbrosa]|uniref:PhzF family phenazine biosynthesis protein n=1 Tax=Pseudoalteromonas umbrosa TaxID=3048489 RepID=UPI0024C3AB39|nr:PhzF family phenazine biosynthesis protein [Pseudoalteromonas sp. B95]MDK1290636.1 PhzF family phenazine biosynthesis protein [Pseudoalteromonas sp. B95]
MPASYHSNLQVFHCNVFCDQPYSGNQATVVCCQTSVSEDTMQLLAREFNTPETMFVSPSSLGISVRYFTPKKEVNSCAHGTLAVASVAFACGYNQASNWVELQTNNGKIRCHQIIDGQGTHYAFSASQPQYEVLAKCDSALADSLGLNSEGEHRAYLTYFSQSAPRLLLHLDEAQLMSLSPNWERLYQAQQRLNTTAVFAFSWQPEQPNYLKGRMFSPLMGINEDPVNGNSVIAFSSVLNHLCQCVGLPLPKDIYAHQGFAFDRQGVVRVTLPSNNEQPDQVRLAGQVLLLYHFTMDI